MPLALAHRDDAQHAAGLVVEDADRVAAGVGDEDVVVGIVHLHIAGRHAHDLGVPHGPRLVVEDADRAAAHIGGVEQEALVAAALAGRDDVKKAQYCDRSPLESILARCVPGVAAIMSGAPMLG
ncbi:MAG TPA: hypothetical protein VKF37_01925 [Chloroflexota bacterium]|nr:hypothetical protein [Chloroflexota bacterium]